MTLRVHAVNRCLEGGARFQGFTHEASGDGAAPRTNRSSVGPMGPALGSRQRLLECNVCRLRDHIVVPISLPRSPMDGVRVCLDNKFTLGALQPPVMSHS